MLSEAYQRVATLQLGCNCCSFIASFAALSSATQKCERALTFQGAGLSECNQFNSMMWLRYLKENIALVH